MVSNVTLGGVPLLVAPESVQWTYTMKVSQKHTIGGRVIQVFGTELGDMIVTGTFGHGDRAAGDTSGWEAAERFRQQIEEFAERSAEDPTQPPIRFVMPSHKWAFDVYVKGLSPLTHSNETVNPAYRLTLHIVEDITGAITKGIKDRYIERLMKGIGWAQSEYNGPTLDEVTELLSPYGGSIVGYIEGLFIEKMQEAMGGVSGGPGGNPANAADPEALDAYLYALRMVESGNNYTAENPYSTASGAYQYIDTTWANYGGYRRAKDAPPAVQDERAARDAKAAFDKYQNWGLVATVHFTGHVVYPTDPEYTRVPGHSSNKTVKAYVEQIYEYMGQYTP